MAKNQHIFFFKFFFTFLAHCARFGFKPRHPRYQITRLYIQVEKRVLQYLLRGKLHYIQPYLKKSCARICTLVAHIFPKQKIFSTLQTSLQLLRSCYDVLKMRRRKIPKVVHMQWTKRLQLQFRINMTRQDFICKTCLVLEMEAYKILNNLFRQSEKRGPENTRKNKS